jgi:hypothetical protein
LAGIEAPVMEDTEETFAELQTRISATLRFLESLTPAQFEGAETKIITLPVGGAELKFDGLTYLMSYVMGNFSFHSVTAYNILRHNGVVLGKMDYLGKP